MHGSDKDSPRIAEEEQSRGGIEHTYHTSFHDYYDALMKLSFVTTKFADQAMLRNIEIHEDVHRIFTSMGLGFLPFMAQSGFQELTCEFIASLQLFFHHRMPNETAAKGYIKFQGKGNHYHISLSVLRTLFELQQGTETSLDNLGFKNLGAVWRSISNESYQARVCKSSTIWHPAIRYAQKFFANTLFSRKKARTVREKEMVWMTKVSSLT